MKFEFDYRQFVSGYYYSSAKVNDEEGHLLGYYRVQELGSLGPNRGVRVSFTWAKDGRADFSRPVVSVESPTYPASVLIEDTFVRKVRTMSELLLHKIQNLEK